jgi:hypothetical protein
MMALPPRAIRGKRLERTLDELWKFIVVVRSLTPQCIHRIDAGGAKSWQVAGQTRYYQ